MSVALFGYAWLVADQADVLWLLLPSSLLGIASAFVWAPIANATTTESAATTGRSGIGCVQHHTSGR